MYDYYCPSCKITEERFVKYTDIETQKCILCKGHMVKKMPNVGMIRGKFADKVRIK